MLEWLAVRLDVGCDKRLMYEYRIEPLNCDIIYYIYYILIIMWFMTHFQSFTK